MVPRSQVAHLALVALGVVLVGAALFQFGQGEHVHRVEPIDGDRIGDDEVLRYSNLSGAAQTAFLDARSSPDGASTVTADSTASEFRYDDAAGRYVIRYDGAYYSLRTEGPGVLGGVDELAAGVALCFGVLSILVGGIDFYRHRR